MSNVVNTNVKRNTVTITHAKSVRMIALNFIYLLCYGLHFQKTYRVDNMAGESTITHAKSVRMIVSSYCKFVVDQMKDYRILDALSWDFPVV